MNYYMLLTENGGELANGLTRDEAFDLAQRIANERGEACEVALPGSGETSGKGWWVEPMSDVDA